ncbi:MAG TPA: exodeoxyribonuclease VII small subunit [Pseudogracilibacillus sp.]|nr:exodeoxyribonuclease VII small subunit [Pseudogracilibacillus sp.]
MSKSEDKELTFEQALAQLEQVVKNLEGENVPLDKLIDYYQEGMELVKVSNHMLKNAEKKMTQVLTDDGELEDFVIEEEME